MRIATLLSIAACFALAACRIARTAPSAEPARATAAMRDASGRELGTLTLTEYALGVTVTGTLVGLTPGAHGIHVHQVGRCEPPFESAGGHWNALSRQHGLDNPLGMHTGDLHNVLVGADGSGVVKTSTAGGSLRGANALLDADGAAIVVHAAADDYRTNPSGNSGARIACGVVTVPAAGG